MRKPNGFYSNKSNKDLVEYVTENFKGSSIWEFGKKEPYLYELLLYKKLIKKLESNKILLRKKDEFYTNKSNKELIGYVDENYKGSYIWEFAKENKGIYKLLIERKLKNGKNLIDYLVNKGTLVRQNNKKIPTKKLIEIINANHRGEYICNFKKNEKKLYSIIIKRKLMNSLVKKRILIRKKKKGGYYTNKSNEKLIEYVHKSHKGKYIWEFAKKKKGLYNALLNRPLKDGKNLIDYLVDEGTLIRQKYFVNNNKFINFLKKDETAKNLAATALLLDGQGMDVEKIIMEIYNNKFKDQNQLHKLLEENKTEVYKLIQDGITNLGYFLGDYQLKDRAIIPVFLSYAIENIPESKIPNLEERLVRILRTYYSPKFNDAPEATLNEIKEKMDFISDKKKEIYQKLYNHYQEIIKLGEEL